MKDTKREIVGVPAKMVSLIRAWAKNPRSEDKDVYSRGVVNGGITLAIMLEQHLTDDEKVVE
jgi:hypothetical protein